MRLPMFPSAATTSRRTGSQAFTLPRPSRTCRRSDAPPGRSISAGVWSTRSARTESAEKRQCWPIDIHRSCSKLMSVPTLISSVPPRTRLEESCKW